MDKLHVVEAKPFTPSEREIELQKWVEPMMREIDSSFIHGEETTDKKNKLIVSDQSGDRAYRQSSVVLDEDGKKITYSHIILPTKLVEDANVGKSKIATLPSGEEIEIPSEILLKYILTEELAHVYSKEKEIDLNEAYANLEGWKQIQNTDGGQRYIAWAISRNLVDANILGLAQIRKYDGRKLPISLTESTLAKINEELDKYFKNPEKAKEEFIKVQESEEFYVDEYSKGFVRLFV